MAELPSHVAEFTFQKLRYVYKNMIYCIREKYWYIDIKCDDKKLMQFKQWKNSTLLALNTRVLRKRYRGSRR